MTAYRTRGGRMVGQKMPSYTTLICDARQPNGDGCPLSTPLQGESATQLRKAAREMGWVRAEGQDYCPEHAGEGQRRQWEAHRAAQHAKGLCEFSGLRVTQCQRTICDCFESPEGAAEIERRANM